MKIAITGASGTVGQAFIAQADRSKFDIIEIDLPQYDASNLVQLTELTQGCDTILHFGWATLKDNYLSGNIDPINNQMIFNAYKVAITNKIPKVIMASSNHAHNHGMRDKDGKVRATINPQVPDSPYGAEKIFMEALGRYYAHDHGLGVVCIRIGNINKEDKPNSDVPSRWMSHRDFYSLVVACLDINKIPDDFQIVYGVGNQDVFDWSNPFGYVPQD